MKFCSRFALTLLGCAFPLVSFGEFSFTPFNALVPRPEGVSFCESYATGISADGNRISGRRYMWWPQNHANFGPETEALTFSRINGVWSSTLLGDLANSPPAKNSSRAFGISGDGSKVFGLVEGFIDDHYGNNSWAALFEPISLVSGTSGYNKPEVTAINYDGSVMVGLGSGTYTDDPNDPQQFRWYVWRNGSVSSFAQYLSGGRPSAVSWDGNTFVGYVNDGGGSEFKHRAFRHREGIGYDLLPRPDSLRHMYAETISGNGQVIAGYGNQFDSSYSWPWYYSDATGTVRVPFPASRPYGQIKAANQDGSVLVGKCFAVGERSEALFWTSHAGSMRLVDYLNANGVDTTGYHLYEATGVSADGKTIAGNAFRTNPDTGDDEMVAFVVKISLPQGLVSFSASPEVAAGGASVTGSISLYKTATQPETVTFTSSNPALVAVPESVTVPTGGKNLSFPLTTAGVSEHTTVMLEAHYGAVTKTIELTLVPAMLKQVRVTYPGSPDPLDAGKPATVILQLNGKAGPGGIPISVYDNSNLISLPTGKELAETFTISEGQTSLKIPVTTRPTATETTRTIYARQGSFPVVTGNLTLRPWYAVTSFRILPSTTIPSGGTHNGVVELNLPARSGGEIVSVTTGGNLISAATTVTVPAGQTSVQFAIVADAVSTDQTTWISVSLGGVTKQLSVKIAAPKLLAIQMPESFTGGQSVSCTVSLTGVAAQDVVVTLSDDTTALNTPSQIVIPAGQSSVTFQISSSTVTTAQTGKRVTATLAGISKKAFFTINP
ncbi:MAG: hypothetical protein ACAH95_01185 [Fimbriimonas sp.]